MASTVHTYVPAYCSSLTLLVPIFWNIVFVHRGTAVRVNQALELLHSGRAVKVNQALELLHSGRAVGVTQSLK